MNAEIILNGDLTYVSDFENALEWSPILDL